jgi:hypothetical protein
LNVDDSNKQLIIQFSIILLFFKSFIFTKFVLID